MFNTIIQILKNGGCLITWLTISEQYFINITTRMLQEIKNHEGTKNLKKFDELILSDVCASEKYVGQLQLILGRRYLLCQQNQKRNIRL